MNKKKLMDLVVNIIFVLVIYQFILFCYYFCKFVYKHFLVKEKNLLERYGENSYVIITGGSSGQGKQFALKLAQRGFNIFLIGSERSKNTLSEINKLYPNVKTELIIKDFRKSFEKGFFDSIEKKIRKLNGNVSMLINNVAHRSAWIPYHEMPHQLINDTIAVGTIVQSQMIRICMPHFLKRTKKSSIVNITAQCIMPTFGFGEILSNEISVPFLSVYEASNAFGHYHGNSIIKEYKKYKNKIDILNVMPGAVLTENTQFLSNTIFNVKSEVYVDNIIRIIGNFYGNTYGYWGHAFSVFLINCFPFMKNPILHNVGHGIATDYMKLPPKKY